MLVFDAKERAPADALRYQFETVSRLSEHEQEVVRELLDAVIVKNQVAGALERIAKPASAKTAVKAPTKAKTAKPAPKLAPKTSQAAHR
jgi:hypothetical protein